MKITEQRAAFNALASKLKSLEMDKQRVERKLFNCERRMNLLALVS
jgi:hypothetical protein